jgi:hypothetical protein
MSISSHIAEQAAQVDRRPTEPQKHAGNYRKGHVRIHGLDVSIENPVGSYREGTDDNGKKWRARLPAHYGYVKRTEGADGDHVDVFIGPHHRSPHVFVIDQHETAGSKGFDEHKVMMGFASEKQARETYARGFTDGKGHARIGHVEPMSVDEFKDWLKNGDTTRAIKHRAEGGRVGLAEGGTPPQPDFDDSAPVKPLQPDFAPDSPVKPLGQQDNDSGWTSYIPAFIRDVPKETWGDVVAHPLKAVTQAFTNIQDRHKAQAERDRQQTGISGFADPQAMISNAADIAEVGKAAMGVASAPFGLVTGPLKSLIGHPMASAEQAVGSVINPSVAAAQKPEDVYETAKQDVGTALSAMRPKGVTPRGPVAAPPAVPPEAAAAQDLANEFGFRLSRGQATGDLDAIRYEDLAARSGNKTASDFFSQQWKDATEGGRNIVNDEISRGRPTVDTTGEAAEGVQAEVADRGARARELQAQADRSAEAEAAAQRGMVADRQRAIDEAVRGGAQPIENVRDAGEIVGQNVREAAEANRNEFRQRYREFGQLPGEFDVQAVRGIGTRIKNDLSFREEPVDVDDHLTPNASKAINALDDMSQLRIQNKASAQAPPNPDEIAGVNLRGIDRMRRKLVDYYRSSRANPTDARATRAILESFDDQIERAISEGLFSGDPRALQVLQEARSSYSRYRQTFGPQRAGDDVGTAMRRIVDRNATPEEVANMVVGAGKLGGAGLPVRIADRLEGVLGADSDAWSAIRQAIWRKASQARNAAGEVDPQKSATGIFDFANSSLARRMFSDQELAAMRGHAQGVRDLDRTIEGLPATQTAGRVREAYQDFFGGQDLRGNAGQVFRRMVDGTATPEEITQGVFKILGSGNPGNATRAVQAIERIVGRDSPAMAAVRQGVWRKLLEGTGEVGGPGAIRITKALNEFLNGSGASVARALYSPEELAMMGRYQQAISKLVIPKYARTNSDTMPALLHTIRKYIGSIGGALGLAAEHGAPTGGFTGWAVGKMLDKGVEKALAVRSAKKLSNSLEDVVPPARKPIGPPRFRQARILPAAIQNMPTSNIGAILSRLQGPVPSGAEEKKKKPKGVSDQ